MSVALPRKPSQISTLFRVAALSGVATLFRVATLFQVATLFRVATLALAGALIAWPASAQDNATDESDPWAGIEEMLVVGSGSGALGLLSETGSVTSFGAEDLSAYGIENTTDLAAFTPNLEVVQSSATTATFFIRGVGLQDFSSNATGAVAIYLDGIPLNMPTLQIAPIFDAESVEVLKGPQGSGAYRNASAGVIAISSRKPDLSDPSFNFSTSQGSFYSVDAIDAYTRTYDAGFSVPIVEDILAMRFAFRSSDTDGLYTNRCGGRPDQIGVSLCREGNGLLASPRLLPPGLNKQVGNKSVYSFRSSWLLAPPIDYDLQVLGTFFFSRRDQDGNFGQAIGTGQGGVVLGGSTAAADGNTDTGQTSYAEPDASRERAGFAAAGYPGGTGPGSATAAFTDNFTRTRPLDKRPFDGDFNRNGTQRVEVMGGTLDLSMDFDHFELSLVGGVARVESYAAADTDLVPNVLFEITGDNRMTQASVDLGLEGELDEWGLTWTAGAFFFWEDLEGGTLTDLATQSLDNFRYFSQDIFTTGVHAGFSLDFFEDFTLSAGARLNDERKQFQIRNIRINQMSFPGFPNFVEVDDELTWREPTGTVQLLYRFSESTTAYVKYNHGFKPGHFNSNGVSGRSGNARVRTPAKQELLDAFEFGMSGSYFDDRLNFTGAIFHYRYQDYQVFVFEDVPNSGPALEVVNANDAQVVGAEVDFRITPLEGYVPEPIEGLEINLRGGWLDSTFLDFQSSSNILVGQDIVEIISDYTGNPLLNSPRFTVSGGVKWTLLMGRLGEIEPRYDFSWTDDLYYDPSRGIGKDRLDGAKLPAFTLGQRAYVLHNLRVTYRPPESRVTLSGWCRNLTDERYKTYAFDVSSFRGVVVNFVGDPRSCGADVSFTW